MSKLTAMQELINLIPSGEEIKQVIFENDMDAKMLDEWLWERLFKGKNWIETERQQHIETYTAAQKEMLFAIKEAIKEKLPNESSGIEMIINDDETDNEDAEQYFTQTFTKK